MNSLLEDTHAKVYTYFMTTDPDIKKAVLDFFDLWQRQVAAVSRSPDATLLELVSKQDILKSEILRAGEDIMSPQRVSGDDK